MPVDVCSQRDGLSVGGSSPAELKIGSAGYPMTFPQRVRYDFGYCFNVEIILLFYYIDSDIFCTMEKGDHN